MEIVGAVLRRHGVSTQALLRRVEGPEQKGLDREGRRAAISSSLRMRDGSATGEVAPLVIVDDVRTTGATLDAAATLLRQGRRTVVGAAVLAIR
jgi:predicted amidophosphoribosyltransferase